MMKSVILASLISSALAFVPAQPSTRTSALNDFCNGYAGGDSVEPMFVGQTGSKNFDPLGLTEVRGDGVVVFVVVGIVVVGVVFGGDCSFRDSPMEYTAQYGRV